MAIEIIGAGYGRTGTASTMLALKKLGFPCYHAYEIAKNQGHIRFWSEAVGKLSISRQEWDELFENYRATQDFPASVYWRELMVAYPDAKVLLTLHPRGAKAWHKSCIDTIYTISTSRWSLILQFFIPPFKRAMQMVRKLVWEGMLNNTMHDVDLAAAQYERHIAEVKAAVPAERLLVFTVADGWQPLCDFLGVPLPDQDFPRVNDTADMRRRMRVAAAVAYTLLTVSIGLLAGLMYWGFIA